MVLPLDPGWAAGLLLALSRTAGFAAASPVFARALPPAGRVLFALAASLALARPVEGELSLGSLAGSAAMNVAVGLVLAFATGMILHLFDVAGEVLDVSSGLASARILDPVTRLDVGVFTRLFRMTSLAVLLAIGGDRLLVRALARSVEAVPLTGRMSVGPAIGEGLVTSLGALLVAGLELAAPALGALFLAEVALGVAARFAPQANVFLLGLSVKVLLALATLGVVLTLFPGAVRGAVETMLRISGDLVRTLSGS